MSVIVSTADRTVVRVKDGEREILKIREPLKTIVKITAVGPQGPSGPPGEPGNGEDIPDLTTIFESQLV